MLWLITACKKHEMVFPSCRNTYRATGFPTALNTPTTRSPLKGHLKSVTGLQGKQVSVWYRHHTVAHFSPMWFWRYCSLELAINFEPVFLFSHSQSTGPRTGKLVPWWHQHLCWIKTKNCLCRGPGGGIITTNWKLQLAAQMRYSNDKDRRTACKAMLKFAVVVVLDSSIFLPHFIATIIAASIAANIAGRVETYTDVFSVETTWFSSP